MPVYKQPGSDYWLVEFQFKGKRYRRSSQTTNKREAEANESAWRQELREQHYLGKPPAADEHTWGEAVTAYYDTVIRPKKGKVASERETVYLLAKLRTGIGEATPVRSITAATVSKYANTLHKAGKAQGTVNNHLAFTRAILRKCEREWNWIDKTPIIKTPNPNNQRIRYMSTEEEERILAKCPPGLYDLVVFLTDTGARRGEAVSLVWDNVDLNRTPRPIVKFLKTKSKEPRGVPLTKRAADLLKRLHDRIPNIKILEKDRNRVFLYQPVKINQRMQETEKDKSVYRAFDNPDKQWVDACIAANVKDLHMHDLRHTFASRLVMRKVPILTVSKLLGHHSLTQTLRYAHLAPDSFSDAIATLDG